MSKNKVLAISIIVAMNSHVIAADSYNSSTGQVDIPCVNVDGQGYQLQMQHQGNLRFKVVGSHKLSNVLPGSDTYQPSNGSYYMPQVSVDGVNFEVFLNQVGGQQDGSFGENSEFEVISAIPTTSTGNKSYRVVDTNQSNCYDSAGSQITCAGSGQDGAYLNDVPSYTNNADGTISDTLTGLMWSQSPDLNADGQINASDKLSASDASSYCDSLNLANYNDWRLPDIKTLYSLIDFSGEDISGPSIDTSTAKPFINTAYFNFAYGDEASGERLIDMQYATSTHYVSTTMNGAETMFGVNLADGRIKGYPTSMGQSAKTFAVHCVRGETYGQNSFQDNANNTISDLATGLMWEQNDSQTAMGWDSAIQYCENSTTAGHSDWRLPNAKELQSIVDYTRSPDSTDSAAINSLFNASQITNEAGQKDWAQYWASTTHKTMMGINASAVYVAFGRALGYMNNQWMDVHGAGAQRSSPKAYSQNGLSMYTQVTDANGNTAYGHGPQGDVVRFDNMVRCVRN